MKNFVDTYWEKEALPQLMAFGEIPNVSPAFDAEWEKHGHMMRAAEMLAEWVKSRNIAETVEIKRLPGRTPLLFIEIKGELEETVLMYGHMDKQPEMDGWREGLHPWKPVREGEYLYGRGLADDGYALFAAIGAVEGAKAQGAKLPRIVIIIEGSEESGSEDLPAYLEELKEAIGEPRAVVTLDSEGLGPECLALTRSLRGIINGYLTIKTLSAPLHSGLATGVVPSSSRILRILFSRIEDTETGRIINATVNPKIPETVRENFKKVADALGDTFLKAYELPQGLEPVANDVSELIERNLWEAGMEVTGFSGLPPPERAGNVFASELHLKLSFRIPPLVKAKDAAVELKKVFETKPPYDARITFTAKEMDNGWLGSPFSETGERAIGEAAQETYGLGPIETGIGASIPFIGMMAKKFPKADQIVVGLLSPSSRAHGPNENLHIPRAKNLTEWLARFLTKF